MSGRNGDQLIVARELQDLAGAVTETNTAVAQAVKDGVAELVEQARGKASRMVQLEMPAPVFEVPVPSVEVIVNVPEQPAPTVNVAAPDVRVAPQINIEAAAAVGYAVQVTKRDADGRIVEFVVLPIRN